MMACHVLWKRFIKYPCFWYTSSVPIITSIDQSSERSKMHLNYKFKFKWILINTRPNKFIRFIQIFILKGRTASDYEWAIPPGNVNNIIKVIWQQTMTVFSKILYQEAERGWCELYSFQKCLYLILRMLPRRVTGFAEKSSSPLPLIVLFTRPKVCFYQ